MIFVNFAHFHAVFTSFNQIPTKLVPSDSPPPQSAYFHNIFKRATAKTLREYVEEQRIKKAINMLMVSEKNLTAIAMECGFSSQAYFNYVFKRKMGKPPREYAKELYENYRK